MRLKLWVEVLLVVLASFFFILIFHDSLLVSFIGIVGALVSCIPLAKYGKLNDIEKR